MDMLLGLDMLKRHQVSGLWLGLLESPESQALTLEVLPTGWQGPLLWGILWVGWAHALQGGLLCSGLSLERNQSRVMAESTSGMQKCLCLAA